MTSYTFPEETLLKINSILLDAPYRIAAPIVGLINSEIDRQRHRAKPPDAVIQAALDKAIGAGTVGTLIPTLVKDENHAQRID